MSKRQILFEEELHKISIGKGADEIIPVLAAYIAGLGVWSDLNPEALCSFVSSVIRDTYLMNKTPPMGEMN